MTEFGKSDLFTTRQLADVGISMVIYPVPLFRLAMGATVYGLDSLKEHGSFSQAVSQMQTRAELYDSLNYSQYNQFDENIYNFELDQG